MALEVQCIGFKLLLKNALRGFATIRIPAMHMFINDVAVHQKGAARCAQLPARPQVKDGTMVIDRQTVKVAYFPIASFEDKPTRYAFSAAVGRAVLKHAGQEALEGVVP
jgi:hypothetical protein